MAESVTANCAHCGHSFDPKIVEIVDRPPCPACGKVGVHIHLALEDEGPQVLEQFRLNVKDVTRRSADNPRLKFHSGDSYWHDGQRWVQREMLADRNNDQYREIIVDPLTGEVIHFCEEPLSAHQGHGDARKKPSSE